MPHFGLVLVIFLFKKYPEYINNQNGEYIDVT